MKRLGLYVFLIAAVIISVELALSVLRQRTIDIHIRVEGAPPAGAAASMAGGADEGTLIVGTTATVVVDLDWTYRIGPRFPITIIRAEVQDANGEVVAETEYTIDCSLAGSLQCDGSHPLILAFDAPNDTRAPWPVGNYALHVTRAYVGIAPIELVTRQMQVAN